MPGRATISAPPSARKSGSNLRLLISRKKKAALSGAAFFFRIPQEASAFLCRGPTVRWCPISALMRFPFECLWNQGYKVSGPRPRCSASAALTKIHLHRGEKWLTASVPPARNANQTRSLLSEARLSNELKSQQTTTTLQSGLCSKTEPISVSILSRSFGSHRIFPIGKLTTTNRSNAGHLSVPNNTFSNITPKPAEKRVYLLGCQ